MGAAHFSSERFRRRVAAVFVFLGLISLSCAGRLPASRQKLEVQKHLKRLNKPALKTIKVSLSHHFEFQWLFFLFLLFFYSVLFGRRDIVGQWGEKKKKISKNVFLPSRLKISYSLKGAVFFVDLLSFSHIFQAAKRSK